MNKAFERCFVVSIVYTLRSVPYNFMKFKIILWKTHVSNQDPVAHLWFSTSITEEEQVLTIDTKPFMWQLSPELTPLPDG